MTLNEFVQMVGEFGERKWEYADYHNLDKRIAKIMEELGEVAECLNKNLTQAKFASEIGDLYVTVCALAYVAQVNLEQEGQNAIDRAIERWGP